MKLNKKFDKISCLFLVLIASIGNTQAQFTFNSFSHPEMLMISNSFSEIENNRKFIDSNKIKSVKIYYYYPGAGIINGSIDQNYVKDNNDEIWKFDEEGNLIEFEYFAESGTIKKQYTYDNNKLLMYELYEYGTFKAKGVFTYNDNGEKVREKYFRLEPIPYSESIHSKGPDGSIIEELYSNGKYNGKKIQIIDEKGNITLQKNINSNNEIKKLIKNTNEYNEFGNLKKQTCYENSKLEEVYIYQYLGNQKLEKETEIYYDENGNVRLKNEKIYSYNDKNQLTKLIERNYDSGEVLSDESFKYDVRGLLTEYKVYGSNNGSLGITKYIYAFY